VGAVRYVKVVLEGQATGLLATFGTARAASAEFGKELDTMAVKHSASFNKLTNSAALFGAGLTLAFGSVIKAGMDFDKQMSNVGAVADANAKQLGQLRQAALDAGKATAYTATQAAQGEEELAKAGISTADIIGGGLSGALSLAAAGNLDLADAAKYASQAMIEFNLHGKDMAHIADVLTAGANKSVTDVQGLGDALGQAGTVAHQAGMSLDETVGVLSLFAQHGLDGVEAGTTFKQMLLKLEGPSGVAADKMKELGLNVYDAQGNFLSASGLADALQKSLSGLTEKERNAALATIFGSRAVRGAIDLYNAGAAGVDEWTNAVNDSGLAAKTANAKLDNLAGDLKKLKGSLSTLAIESSGGATKGLRVLTEAATGATNAIADMPTPITSTLTVLTGVAGVATLAGAGFVKARQAGQTFLTTLADMGPTGTKAAGALGKIGGALGKASLWGAGALVAYEGFHALFGYLGSKSEPTKRNVDELTKSLAAFAISGRAAGELAKTFGEDMRGLSRDIQTLATSGAKIRQLQFGGSGVITDTSQISRQLIEMNKQLGSSTQNITATDQALADLVTNGQAVAASNAIAKMGLSTAEVNQLFPQYTKAAGDMSVANQTLAGSMTTVTTSAGVLQLGLDELLTQGGKLADVIDTLSGANEDYAKSNIAAEQALSDLSDKLKENDKAHVKNRKSLDDSTQAGRDNLNMILSAIDTDKKQFQTSFAKLSQTEDQTSALKDATAEYDAYIGRLKATLKAEGFNAKQVDELIQLYGAIPPVASTTIKTPGMATALDQAGNLLAIIRHLPNGKTIRITVKTDGHGSLFGGALNRWGGVYEHAAIGTLREASTYSTANPGRYMIAEPSTGGEAFIPKYGDRRRSLGILGTAASWYGAQVMPRGSMVGGGSVTVQINAIASDPGGRALLQQIRYVVDQAGGDPVKVFTPRGVS